MAGNGASVMAPRSSRRVLESVALRRTAHGCHVYDDARHGQPAQATTDVSGQVRVTFVAGGSNGTANINAISGGASAGTAGAIKIAVGTRRSAMFASARIRRVSAFGGTTTIT